MYLTNLWSEFRGGTKESFVLLYKAYYKHLYAYGCRICTDGDLVEECIQQLFYELWDSRDTIAEVTYVKSYLQTILRRKIRKELVQLEKYDELSSLHHDKFEIECSFEDLMISGQESEALRQKLLNAFNELSSTQFELVRLKFYENLSYDEISSITSLRHSVIYNQVSRALKVIKKYIVCIGAIAAAQLLVLVMMPQRQDRA
ncbi:RNA polymerase sigma factor [Solitalea lacus]|uniref:RNA polymerase sigma factor n=1 Tax=Solitalea lacus TaxID=2911172 RepID=UPI001EDC5195|nr:sigma-70 family RNA polymerase sigma factor [Solitalea lacus]UKJ06818.1 sigma-70 family RNA polymerase sigma factor [Solitalea lacus]